MRTRLTAAALAACGALLLSACGGSFAHSATAAPPAASTSAGPTPATSGEPPMDSGTPETGIPTAPVTVGTDPMGEASRTPGDVAQAVMTAYAVPLTEQSMNPDVWYRRVAPYLLPEARRDYSYVDPSRVKAHQLLGLASVTRQTDYLAEVTQNTDAGAYTVHLVRDDQGLWKVSAIDEPPATPGS